MNSLPWYECVVVLLCTTAVTMFLTPYALRLALRHEIVDRPSAIKAQSSPVPYLGGLAIILAFSCVVGIAAVIHPPPGGLGELATILAIAVALGILGVVDDIRGLGPWLRLSLETAAGIVVYVTGSHAQVFDGHTLPDAIVTVLWVVGVTNAFNILDNMDGLSAGIAGISSVSLFVVSYLNAQYLVATLSLALVGCAAGFLRHNFHPAKIYMGDAGALYFGFLIAVLCLKLRAHEVTRISFAVPILIVGVPLFDSLLVVVARLAHHKNPLQGGRDHTSHRLVFVGLSVRASVALIYAAQVSLGWLAIAMARIERPTVFVLSGLVAALGLFLGTILFRVPVYESSTRRHLMLQEVARHNVQPDKATESRAENGAPGFIGLASILPMGGREQGRLLDTKTRRLRRRR